MLTDTTLRSAIEALWDKLWSGGLANPLDAIEQLSFLLFLKRLDEREQDAERAAKLRGKNYSPVFPSPDLRWSHWTQLPADKALKHVKDIVFPFIKTLGGAGGSFAAQMENAEFKLNKPSLLIEACKAIDAMQISAQNQDVQGDLYEYLLSNPPFKGAIDSADVNPTLPVKCKKTEVLFLHLFLRLLENGGRAAVTLERLRELEAVASREAVALSGMLK